MWADQTTELGARYRWVQVFENRGEAMGASNPHPHGQIWAGDALPVEAAHEDATQARHLAATGRRLLVDYAAAERGGPRVVAEAPGWLVARPVLGVLAVRDAARARGARPPAWPTSTTRRATGWPRALARR